MQYDRKIKYFDYRKDDERIGGGGFVKMEARNGKCNITIQISGLHATDSFSRQVYMIADGLEKQLCIIELKAGRGVKSLSLPMENLSGSWEDKVPYEALQAIRIPIATATELYCAISEGSGRENDLVRASRASDGAVPIGHEADSDVNDSDELDGDGAKRDMAHRDGFDKNVVGGMPDEDAIGGSFGVGSLASKNTVRGDIFIGAGVAADAVIRAGAAEDTVSVDEKSVVMGDDITIESLMYKDKLNEDVSYETAVNRAENKEQAQMQEDKWQQLAAIYPHIKPFRDEREYLKLGPEDFVIFNSRFYKLVHNSFLLHGYYNYQHLILARVEQRGQPFYYIGVPGNFYDREKQVALMFGFESFECRVEPADTGDYGYYMIRADI